MQRKIIIVIFAMFIIFSTYKLSFSLESRNTFGNDIWINNINEKNIKIKVMDMKVNKESINIGETYKASAILTMHVANKGTEIVELSNLDIYPYQGNKPTKYFVSTATDNINGFIGDLQPNEEALVKIGVALHNTKDDIELVFTNIEDEKNEKAIQTINIK